MIGVDEILKILRESDSYAAAQLIELDGSAEEIGKRYSEVSKALYWEKKDVTAAILIGRFGISYCLGRANDAEMELSERLRGVAKGMAFNLASFAWRGWDENGVTITAADEAAGCDAAKLNLRLAVELKKDAKPMMNAHWMVGAYWVAEGKAEEAFAAFDAARRFAEQARDASAEGMCRAYAILARLTRDSSVEGEFTEALASLRKIESKDAGFYVEQLKTARRVFCVSSGS
jgi:hypothetical protein